VLLVRPASWPVDAPEVRLDHASFVVSRAPVSGVLMSR
jgi:hypothetical protein